MKMHHMERGMSLIELMIVVAVIGILGIIAYPSFEEQIRKARRADAQSVLLESVQFMERHYTNNNSYVGATLPITESPKEPGTKYYDISFTRAVTATEFSIRAVPKNAQSSDRCGTMTITNTGAKTVSTSATGCWR